MSFTTIYPQFPAATTWIEFKALQINIDKEGWDAFKEFFEKTPYLTYLGKLYISDGNLVQEFCALISKRASPLTLSVAAYPFEMDIYNKAETHNPKLRIDRVNSQTLCYR
jgi:hypothetical protein